MPFAEDHARLLLVGHTVLAAAAIGASTHLVVWLAQVRRGRHGRLAAARRFAWYAALLHAAAFLAGNLMYPTYKVRVKAEYLQSPDAVVADAQQRMRQADDTRQRFLEPAPASPSQEDLDEATVTLPGAAERVARWFDAKEHWVAMGLIVALALAWLLPAWRPERGEGAEVASVVWGLALFACLSLWMGAIVGVLTASWRAVG